MYNGSSRETIDIYRKDIKFEEQSFSSIAGEHTLYFIAPKELLNGLYPDAESMEIAVRIPFRIYKSKKIKGSGRLHSDFDAAKAMVEFSPTKNGLDYNWYCGDLDESEINYLFDIYHKYMNDRIKDVGC